MEYCPVFYIHIELHSVEVHNKCCSAVVQIIMGHFAVEVHTKHWSQLEYCVSFHIELCFVVVHTLYYLVAEQVLERRCSKLVHMVQCFAVFHLKCYSQRFASIQNHHEITQKNYHFVMIQNHYFSLLMKELYQSKAENHLV